MKKKDFKAHYLAVKFIPFICVVVMTIHWYHRLIGVNSIFAEWFSGCGFCTLLLYFLASKFLQLCWVHKLQIAYIALGSFSIDFHRAFGFGGITTFVRLVLLVLGVIVTVISLTKFKCPPYEDSTGVSDGTSGTR